MTMEQVLALLGIDVTGMDLSMVTVQGIIDGDYTLYDILSMVQLRQEDMVETLESTSIIPTTAAGLSGMGTTFTLSTYQDLINLQKLSQTTSLEGYTFTFLKILDETNQAQWNFSKASVDGAGYIGIGNETYPFKGTLNTYVNGMVCTITKPMCNYVSTGASFEGFNFNANGAKAAISEYLVTADASASTKVNLKKIVVGGTIGSASTQAAGGLFAYVENKTTAPIELEFGENASDSSYSVKMTAKVNGIYAGGMVGMVNSDVASTGPVQITSKISTVAGTVTGQGTGAAGGIVGKMGQNSTLTMDTSKYVATIAGKGNNGGAVGMLEKATFVTNTAMTVDVNVASTNNMTAGGLIGRCDDALKVSVENVTLNGTDAVATNKNVMSSMAGGIIGYVNDTNATLRTEPMTFKNISLIQSNVSAYDKGGIVGNLKAKNVVIDTISVNNQCKIGDTADGVGGGVVGRVFGRQIEIKDATIDASQICAYVRGGLIGTVDDTTDDGNAVWNTQVKITNASVSTSFSTGHAGGVSAGGLVGRTQKGGLVNISGNINITTPALGSATNRGYIVGEQRGALVYFEENATLTKTGVNGIYDNVGNYGGVIQNISSLISYDAQAGKNVTGTVAGTGTESDPYQITCKEDMMRLAIVLNTDGAFGADCFGVAPTRDGAKQLRSAHFVVTNSIDLTGTGVYDLSRNDKYQESVQAEYAFRGTFAGSDNSITITMDSHETNQYAIGLFPSVSNATFKNITVKTADNSPWAYARSAAGIAPFVFGSLNLDTVTSKVHLIARQENTELYYGAITARMVLNNTYGASVATKDIGLNATIENVRLNQYVGGLTARVVAADAGAGTTITLNGTTTIGNRFTFKDNYGWKVSYAGGLIGVITTQSVRNQTFVNLTAENVIVDNQVLDYSGARYVYRDAALGNNDVGVGSFIGHYWDNVEADFKNITVKGDDTRITAPIDNARYGALFGKISGKLYLHDVDFLAGTFENSVDGSSLLVSHGKWLLMLLDEYTIDPSKVTIVSAPARFDEIMGMNIGGDAEWGGIVSIKSDAFRTMSSSGYVNQVLPVNKNNSFTRYYYNLFEQSPAEYTAGMIENNVIDTPAKLIVWHLNQYVAVELDRFVTGYFGTGSNAGKGGVSRTIDGQINLLGYSYYPTPRFTATLTGTNDAEIIFHGDTIAQLEAGKLPANAANPHYRMHAGLLINANGPAVKNMKLSGSVTNLGGGTGAIVSNYCYNLTLENIILNGLHVTDYNGTAHLVGLILSHVWENSTVNMTGIKMTGYPDTVYGHGSAQKKFAASALIGHVGAINHKNIKLYFSQMEIPYVRKTEDAPNAPVQTESPLRYASFIDKYEYTTDMDIYTGQGIYLFTQAEYDAKKVTLGKEIKHGLMYNDNMVSLPEAVRTEAGTISPATNMSSYLPYVCETCSDVTIQVNPKRGDFIEGCGTYEDPYVINSPKQVFQLYQYLSPKSVNNDTYLSGWKVNQLGVHDTHVELTYGDENFPTRDQMRCAYYVVTAKIDLTEISDINDYVVSNDFDGIGSSAYPFAGVIYGKDGNQYEIILPGHDKGRVKTNYGLFNIMKGAVVKDLHITTLTAPDPGATKKDDIFINTNGGSVAARIVGGDNIIDNVKVSTKFIANGNATLLGGYVGLVEKGGLIVRNLDSDNLSSFNPCIKSGATEIANTTGNVSAIAGKVQDGYILYEGLVNGASNNTDKVLTATDFGFAAESLELSKTFPMVNAGYLNAKAGSQKIQITVDDATKTSSVVLKNDAHLEIVALALNSDALSSYSTYNASKYNGYDERAICRKAQYSDMGTGATADGTLAMQYDEGIYNLPYLLYKYFEINGDESRNTYGDLYVTVGTANISKLNKLSNATNYTTTYQLTNGTYDMTDYQYAFRGLGELYNISYSRFNADFDGQGSTIIANMTAGFDASITTTGLFNDLHSSAYCLDKDKANAQKNVIKNLVIEGSFVNSHNSGNVGSVAGTVYGNWTFDNITLNGTTVDGKLTAGGIVGKILNDTTYNGYNVNNPKYAYQFTNCKILDKTDGLNTIRSKVSANGGPAGGIIGIVSTGINDTYWHGGTIEIKNNTTDGLDVVSNISSSGGLVGLVANTVTLDMTVEGNSVSDTTVLVKGNGRSAGSVIGAYLPVSLSGNLRPSTATLLVKDNTVSDGTVSIATNYNASVPNGVGGLVGLIYPRVLAGVSTTVTFEGNVVEDTTLGEYDDGAGTIISTTYPVGGLVGTAGGDSITITDCKVYNTVDATDANAAVFSSKGTDVGGFVGSMETTSCTVNYTHTADLTAETEVAGGIDAAVENLNIIGLATNSTMGTRVGGVFGSVAGKNYSLNISGVKVRDCIIKTANTYVGENQSKCGAGGVIGILASLHNPTAGQMEVTFNNILIAGVDIAGHSGGGLVGINRTTDTDCYNIEAQNIAVRQNNILGQGAGGIFGMDYATGKDLSNSYKNIIVDKNKIGAIQSTSDYIWVGGFTGRANNSGVAGAHASAKQYYNEVVISDNYIVGYSNTYANTRIGGMFGMLSNGTGGRDFFIYNPIISNNYIGIWNNGSDVSAYTMDALKSITADKVGLLKFDAMTRNLSIVSSLPATMEEKDIQLYSRNVGSIAGKMMTSFRVLVLRPQITFNAGKIRPVVDCGVAISQINNGVTIDGNYVITDSSSPYSYREYFNVIYFDPKAPVSAAGNKVMNAFASGRGETEYLFDNLDEIMTVYNAVDNAPVNTDALLDAYRLNLYYTATNGTKLSIADIYEKAYYNGSGDPNVISQLGVTNDLVGLPVIVYDAQNGTASDVINSFVQALTNAGGTLNNKVSGITSVTAKRAIVKNGVITLDTSGTKPSVTASGVNLTYNHYDTYDAVKGTSITLLEISYGWTNALGEENRETMYLPVYVLERLDVRTFIRMSEGAVYSYDEMKNSTIGDGTSKHDVIMANDTTYTMAIEFLYGSGRYKFENETVNKILKLQENTVSGTKPKAFPAGTKLTLVDVETGYAYYYEATELNQEAIKLGLKDGIAFTDFRRVPVDDTTAYKIRTMAEVDAINPDSLQANYASMDTGNKVYSNVGVERYLLIVDGSDAVTENALYDITVVADENQSNNSKDIYPADMINITSIPGLKVGFEGKGTRTTITGMMMRNQEVLINAVYGIKAQKLAGQGSMDEAPYWTMASSNEVIDSANNSKYLELAIYLQDAKGNRITLPQNTNISMNGQILTASGSQSVFYFYKDTNDAESLDGITSDKEWEEQIRLGFETAILDSYNDEYSVVIELLRTDAPNYPMSGDKPDYYGEEISARIQTDLAIAVLADNLIDLGINTYLEETHNYEIPFTSMIDFGSVIEFDLEDGEDVVNAQLTKWCDQTKYQISYRLYKKVQTAGGKEYVPINDQRISLWREDKDAKGGYSLFKETKDQNGRTVYVENRTFTQSEVRKGTKDAKGLMTDKLMLKVDTKGITAAELSNYMLEMSVVAYDAENTDGPIGDEAVLQDFFIFTIARLKTDME